MILAAGQGKRMRPLTDNCPKPLLKVAGKPLIEHHIERLARCGFTQLVINLAYRGEQIKEYLGTGERWGVELCYSHESEALETGGGIFQALPVLTESADSFLVVNGDIWCDLDYRCISLAKDDLAQLLMVDNPLHNPRGDFVFSDGRLSDINPEVEKSASSLTFSGISILTAELFSGQQSSAFPLAPLLRQAMLAGKVAGTHYAGHWVDVGTPQRLQQLEQYLNGLSRGVEGESA